MVAHVPQLRRCQWAESATIRDLLANRLPVPLRAALEFGFDDYAGADDEALARLVEAIAGWAQSGDHLSYRNVGWCVLGRAIETVTGVVWEEAMRRLLAPARLSETTWTASAIVDRVVGHEASPVGPIPVEPLLCRAVSPAGSALASSLKDMLRYAVASRQLRAGTVAGGARRRLVPRLARHSALGAYGSGACIVRVNFATVRLDPLRVVPEQLTPYAGVYGWADRRVDVTESARGLLVSQDGIAKEAVSLDRRTSLVDRDDPDTPTITLEDFDPAGRPGVLYDMMWGLAAYRASTGKPTRHARRGECSTALVRRRGP